MLSQNPDVVVIALGANNGLRAMSIEALETDLRAIVAGVEEHGAHSLLLGIQAPPNLGTYAVKFEALYATLANEVGIAFVPRFLDGVGGVHELNLNDGIHPNVEGHKRLAANITPKLRDVLSRL